MKSYVTITGLDETVTALRSLDEQLPDVLHESLVEGTDDVAEALGNYPAQPRSVQTVTRWHSSIYGAYVSNDAVHQYVRTFAYRDTQVKEYVSDLESYVATPDSAAPWVRGDGDGYEGAWFHAGIWETITEIVARMQTAIEDIFNRRIEALIWRLFGG